jgi:hypothetical protein
VISQEIGDRPDPHYEGSVFLFGLVGPLGAPVGW